MERITVDPVKVEQELKSIAGDTPIKIEFHPRQEQRLLIRETDKAVNISINPAKVRTANQLSDVISSCTQSLTFGGI